MAFSDGRFIYNLKSVCLRVSLLSWQFKDAIDIGTVASDDGKFNGCGAVGLLEWAAEVKVLEESRQCHFVYQKSHMT
jgi:hypothetical protein